MLPPLYACVTVLAMTGLAGAALVPEVAAVDAELRRFSSSMSALRRQRSVTPQSGIPRRDSEVSDVFASETASRFSVATSKVLESLTDGASSAARTNRGYVSTAERAATPGPVSSNMCHTRTLLINH